MKIEVSRDTFRLAEVFTISRGSRTEAHVLTVTITDGAHTGRGECVPYARYEETLDSVAAQIEGFAGGRTDLPDALPPGAARNALDCAFWDLAAKQDGRRAWQLAGLEPPAPLVTAFTLSLDTAERMEAQARRHAARPLLKIKLGAPDDMPRLEAVRRGAPDATLIVDANEGWSPGIYRELVPHLTRPGVALVEQPVPAGEDEALRGMERPIPLCADESCHTRADLDRLEGLYDVVNVKLDKAGGLTEALALRDEARRRGFRVMVGCMVGSSLAMAPATFVAQGVDYVDLDGPLLLSEDRKVPLRVEGSLIHPPEPALWG